MSCDYRTEHVRGQELQAGAYTDERWGTVLVDATGQPLDLQGATLAGLVKRSLHDHDSAAVAALAVEATSPAEGALEWRLRAGSLPRGDYWYSILVRWPLSHPQWPGEQITVARGRLRVVGEATRGGLA